MEKKSFLNCKICSLEFDDTHIPLVLECGHSYGESCISTMIIDKMPLCSRCQKDLDELLSSRSLKKFDLNLVAAMTPWLFPKNRSLMEVIKIYKFLSQKSSSIFQKRIELKKYLECEICSLEYNETSVIPIIIKCGHSFCKRCITKISEGNKLCKKCKRSLEDYVSPPTINHSILEAVDELKFLQEKNGIVEVFENSLKTENEAVNNFLLKISKYLEINQKNLREVKRMKKKKNKVKNEKYLQKRIANIDADYMQAEEVFKIALLESKLTSYISPHDFNQLQKFLQTIYAKIKNGEDMYIRHHIKNEIRFGKISIGGKKVFFHTLDLLHNSIPSNCSLIEFQEIKRYLHIKNFQIFIDINSDRITSMLFIDILNNQRVNTVINYSTGEWCCSYKDSFVKRFPDFQEITMDSNPQLFSITFVAPSTLSERNHLDFWVYRNHCINQPGYKFKQCSEKTIYVDNMPNGGLFLFCASNSRIPEDILGRVKFSSDQLNLTHQIIPTSKSITDCGIVMDVEKVD